MNHICPMLDIYLAEDVEDLATTDLAYCDSVCYPLYDTMALCAAADNVRARNGLRRMYTGSESEMDLGGWYDFYIYVTDHDAVSNIEFVVCNPFDKDEEGKRWYILLSDSERKEIFQRLNLLSEKQLHYSCNQLLDFLRKRVTV
jgi:hypothetical protein